MTDDPYLGWVDESGSNHLKDPDTYILAATVCAPGHVETATSSMASLLLPGQRKLHWRDESDKRRLQIARTIAQIGQQLQLVVVRNGFVGERPERSRHLAMQRLLPELDGLGVATVTFESRGPADDRRDRRTVDGLRASRYLGKSLRIEHESGAANPLLSIPDAVCGAVTQARTGDPRYLQVLEAELAVQIIELDP